MEVLFHFIFQLIKIGIIASIYSALLIGIMMIIRTLKPIEYLENVKKEKKKYWFVFGLSISIGLFIYSFTYWGNHGLGDSARIPIGNFKEVGETNGTDSYIEPENYPYGAIMVHSFKKSDNFLTGKTEVSPVDRPKPFFSWDLSKDQIVFFDSENEYNLFAKDNGLPKSSEFKTFRESYKEYWGGMKFWMLP